MTQTSLILGFTTALVALGFACTSSDGNSSPSNNTGSSSNASQSVPSCKNPPDGGTKCTEAEAKPYTDCMLQRCDATYTECVGADYKKGAIGGTCAAYFQCITTCDCSDVQCLLDCAKQADAACQSCVQRMASCGESCQLPACAKAPASAATCTDLKACCDKITTDSFKSACTSMHTSANGKDEDCGYAYEALKSYCP